MNNEYVCPYCSNTTKERFSVCEKCGFPVYLATEVSKKTVVDGEEFQIITFEVPKRKPCCLSLCDFLVEKIRKRAYEENKDKSFIVNRALFKWFNDESRD